MEMAIQTAIDAISLGSLYALMALGIGVIFGIMRLVNFAHGDIIMVSGYMMFFLSDNPLILLLIGAVAVAIALALVMELVAFRPVRNAEPSTLLTTSFAVSFLLTNGAVMVVGALGKSVSIHPVFMQNWYIGDFRVAKLSVITVLVTVILVTSLTLFFKRTALGNQMRAAAENFRMARLVGVRANTVVATAFAISGLLAAAVAILLVAQTGVLRPDMGLIPVIIAFVSTVIGGLGSLLGAALGGFVFGCLTAVLQMVLPIELSPYRDAFVFTIVILVLLFRPQGLMGRPLGGRVV